MVKVGDGTLLPMTHTDTSVLPTHHKSLTLTNVLHVHQLHYNLLSVRQLCRDNDYYVVFASSSVHVKDNTMGDVLSQAPSSGPIYIVPVPAVPVPANFIVTESGDLWHRCLGHCGAST